MAGPGEGTLAGLLGTPSRAARCSGAEWRVSRCNHGFICLGRQEESQLICIPIWQTRTTCWPSEQLFGWFIETEGLTGVCAANWNGEAPQTLNYAKKSCPHSSTQHMCPCGQVEPQVPYKGACLGGNHVHWSWEISPQKSTGLPGPFFCSRTASAEEQLPYVCWHPCPAHGAQRRRQL